MRDYKTLQLTRPFGRTLLLTLLLLPILLAFPEMLFRQPMIQDWLISPGMGGRHFQLGDKLILLNSLMRESGEVDCIAIGSSLIDLAFDPETFAEAYARETGEEIRCFNFAMDAITAAGAGAVAKILVEDYEPKLLIFGTDARDYVVDTEDPDSQAILGGDWIQHRSGNPNLRGWLLEHFYVYRYWSHMRLLWNLNIEEVQRSDYFNKLIAAEMKRAILETSK